MHVSMLTPPTEYNMQQLGLLVQLSSSVVPGYVLHEQALCAWSHRQARPEPAVPPEPAPLAPAPLAPAPLAPAPLAPALPPVPPPVASDEPHALSNEKRPNVASLRSLM
jgi:hypothetical protein